MECNKCGKEIEPIFIHEWISSLKNSKLALYVCPECKTRFVSGKDNEYCFEKWIAEHEVVKEWMQGRPQNTRRCYARNLMHFCQAANIQPEAFQNFEGRNARNVAWSYLSMLRSKTSVFVSVMSTIKSFYRNKDGDILTFDSRRGGKHYVNTRRVKRAAFEHIPSRNEMWKIIDMAKTLRDKAIFCLLFQSGIRLNALQRLTVGIVKKQLEKGNIPLRLRITDEIDTKMQGYGIAFYDTFVGQECINLLKEYVRQTHANSEDNKPLFILRNGNRVSRGVVYANFKATVKRAGFNPKAVAVHTIRKAFKRVVRNTELDDEFKEAIMGHILPGSRENYFARNEPTEIENAYKRIRFGRENAVTEEHEKMIADLQEDLKEERQRTEVVGAYIDKLVSEIELLKKQITVSA